MIIHTIRIWETFISRDMADLSIEVGPSSINSRNQIPTSQNLLRDK